MSKKIKDQWMTVPAMDLIHLLIDIEGVEDELMHGTKRDALDVLNRVQSNLKDIISREIYES